MENTNAKVYLSIYGESFPIKELSDILELEPTESYKKGDEILVKPSPHYHYEGRRFRKETSWELGTDYEETYELEEQINKVLIQLKNKEELITNFCEEYNLKCLFMIVIKMNNGETPVVGISHEFVKMAYQLGAEIHFDLYANPYKSDFELTR
ncbi:MAG: DUF4279 domain-containing protein [Candidatus Pristimantibacillus lignocellulolyticus]|uniref:DUF4279 domain-containing protein n=1 Tax=Candidatus Pristimantibacillus lignocellulolyticus TaxID=2994561 RepID=A0A9J6ZDB4_9BACL|nr:MAG: DUF4279 domain-containing protein [Candidatus Pristimantibacillus lignocellulolyticus]